MGGKSKKGDNMDWSIENTKALIHIIYDPVKKRQLQGSTFKMTVWEEINTELAKIIGENYGVNRSKGKFNHLRLQHREFLTLLALTEVTWSSEYNKVNAPKEVWADLCSKGKFYKQFKKHGFEYDYDILGEIFNSSTTTGKLSQASTQEPPTSDEKREIEEEFLSRGVHIGSKPTFVDENGLDDTKKKKKRKSIGSSSENRRKEAKNSGLDKIDATLTQWSEIMNARAEASKAKAERYKAQASQATSPISDPDSIDECMILLDSMEDIPSKIYNKALEKFTNKDWRQIFVKMPSFRRHDWRASLDQS